MPFIVCVLGALLWAAIMLLGGELLAWLIGWIFNVAIPMRVRQLYTAIVVIVFVLDVLSCAMGSPLFPHPWAMMGHGYR